MQEEGCDRSPRIDLCSRCSLLAGPPGPWSVTRHRIVAGVGQVVAEIRICHPAATNGLADAGESSGTVGVQQAVTLPAAGTQVEFTVYVLDRRLNRSNELMGTFVAP